VPVEADTILKPAEADIILDQVPAEADIIPGPAEADIILVGHVLACRGRYNTGGTDGSYDTSLQCRMAASTMVEREGFPLFGRAFRTEWLSGP
jgi:hypothetical protein